MKKSLNYLIQDEYFKNKNSTNIPEKFNEYLELFSEQVKSDNQLSKSQIQDLTRILILMSTLLLINKNSMETIDYESTFNHLKELRKSLEILKNTVLFSTH